MLRLISYYYWTVIVLSAPVFFVVAVLIWLLTLPFDRRRVILHMYSCLWAVVFVALNPLWRLNVTGRDRLPWKGPAVIVANHASLVDILVVFDLFRPFKWVSKIENFKIPFIGWNMRLNGYVPLLRGDRASVIAMLARCSDLLGKGNPVLFFPEGTRSKDGAMRPFKDGAFELAVQHGVPLIPVAVHGTARALPKHGMVLEDQVNAHVEVLEPMAPADYASVPELREAARDRIATALSRGEGERVRTPR